MFFIRGKIPTFGGLVSMPNAYDTDGTEHLLLDLSLTSLPCSLFCRASWYFNLADSLDDQSLAIQIHSNRNPWNTVRVFT